MGLRRVRAAIHSTPALRQLTDLMLFWFSQLPTDPDTLP